MEMAWWVRNNAFGVDWVNVGYFAEHADRLLSCQLVIIDRFPTSVMRRVTLTWNSITTRCNGNGGTQIQSYSAPRAGFSDGTNDYELPGSGVEGAFLDTNAVTGLIYHNLNSSVPGRYFFSFRNGEPLDLCLEPAS